MSERIVNKKLNRLGYFWARKFETSEDALTALREYSVGQCQVYNSPRGKKPFWILLKNFK